MNKLAEETPATDGSGRIGPGRLVLVVGPSGAGKDTLMEGVRKALGGDPACHFVRRLVTRDADPGSEDHGTISRRDYEALASNGGAALHWEAHGHGYVLPVALDADIRAGKTVFANGSRKMIGKAREKYETVVTLLITAPREVLAERLLARGRETREEIARRLDRADLDYSAGDGVIAIENTGSISDGVRLILKRLGY
ncbi:phosphonate metabolism protein/1,5-bisphosphokinase (PRPP-forming) PhnN [Rhizobiales bacterium]|uniref:phosphonate metabolism protein/1,5-bisphosphokinase (PRPP-forming) PhnN n=1 Tax=Hongsoonwoonella zoysiae TaxID=2821844 RepID=UPI0015607C23|nr:phosphonate metabolism protein/1,5-bisphosphokinase (PRPP-forming) PhnN [Hongsoonwoonella zoysiae]NRG16945.1 phosphonate metabolism protein/1,5-bisphosphokinase (PRPP-forming) PhnN [Hongsoonwoonella zoysiae]